MRRHRTTAVFFLVAACGRTLVTSAAGKRSAGAVPRLVFPLVAKTDLWDNYGDPRPNGRHAGIDMENPWRAPVVAVEDGTSRVRGVRPRRLHALPLRPQRDDVPLHPPEQRPHRAATTTRAGASRMSRSPCRTARGSRPASRSPGTVTRATQTATLTSISRCTRTTARTSTRSSTCGARSSRSSQRGRGGLQPRSARKARRGGRGRGDARGRPRPPVPRRPLAGDRHARRRADRAARNRRRAVRPARRRRRCDR